MTPRQHRLALGAWVAVCLIWGTTYFAIRITLESMPPWLMSGFRWTAAGSIITLYLWSRGERLPRLHIWRGAALLGFTLLVLGNGGVVWAEQYVPSGLAAVMVAASPFWMTGYEALRSDGERLTGRVATGLGVGLLGIVLLVWPDLASAGAGARGFLAGVISLQIACIGWTIGSSYSRRHAREENVLSTTAAQMLAGGVMMLAIGTVTGEWHALRFVPRTTTALVYLATIGAIGGFVAYTYALRHLPISLVSLYAYINPVIAVALGAAFLGEAFDMRMAFAAALVFGGVAIVKAPRQRVDARAKRSAPRERSAPGPSGIRPSVR